MKRRTVLALCLCLTLAGTPVGVAAASDSLLSVTEEAQIQRSGMGPADTL